MNRAEGLHLARALRARLLAKGYPVRRVLLYGSVATETTHPGSDIDIAVVAEPFRPSQFDENVEVFLLSKEIDLRIETVCLHPADFANQYFTLAQEIERHGIEV